MDFYFKYMNIKLKRDYIATTTSDILDAITGEIEITLSKPVESDMGWIIIEPNTVNEEQVFFHRRVWTTVYAYWVNRSNPVFHASWSTAMLTNGIDYVNYAIGQSYEQMFIYKKDTNNVVIKGGKYYTPDGNIIINDLDTSLSLSGKTLTGNAVNYVYIKDKDYFITTTENNTLYEVARITTSLGGVILQIERSNVMGLWTQWIQGNKWDKWDTGNWISWITQISSIGLIDTYRIAMTDWSHFDFTVENWADGLDWDDWVGIVSVTLQSTVGKVKTYRILFTNATTFDFTVTDGNDWLWTGDMLASTYDPANWAKQVAFDDEVEHDSNKKTSMTWNESSNSFYLTAKAVYDWATWLFATLTGVQTLTNKTIALWGNTVSGTIAQFNTACTDADFATGGGTASGTNTWDETNSTILTKIGYTPANDSNVVHTTWNESISWNKAFNNNVFVWEDIQVYYWRPLKNASWWNARPMIQTDWVYPWTWGWDSTRITPAWSADTSNFIYSWSVRNGSNWDFYINWNEIVTWNLDVYWGLSLNKDYNDRATSFESYWKNSSNQWWVRWIQYIDADNAVVWYRQFQIWGYPLKTSDWSIWWYEKFIWLWFPTYDWNTTYTKEIHLNAQVRYTNWTEWTWKVLTSDASGNATWQAPAWGAPKQFRITIPWELVADTSNYQGLYFRNTSWASWTITNVYAVVWKAAAWTWAAAAFNLYKSSWTNSDGINTSATNLFTSAVDLGTWYTSSSTPNTTTVEDGRWLSLRVTSSAGATNKASDLQVIITLA